MADEQPISPAEAAELIKLMKELRDITIDDVDAFEKLIGGARNFRKELSSLRKEQSNLNSDVNTFYSILKNTVAELSKQKNAVGSTTASFRKISDISSKLKYDQDDINTLSKKQIQNLDKKLQQERISLETNKKINGERLIEIKNELRRDDLSDVQRARLQTEYKNIVDSIRTTNSFLKDQELGYENLRAVVRKRLEEEEKINRTLGISGKIIDGIVGSLGKIGISSDFFEDLKDNMREAAKSGDKWKVVTSATKGLFQGIGDALKDPITKLTILLKLFNFFVNAALKANSQAVELGKSLGYGADRADAFRENLVGIVRDSSNINVTTANLVEAFNELVQATGFAYEFTADQLETQIKLTKQVGLQADEAAQIQRFAVLNNKTSKETYDSFVRGLTATRNQLKVGINFRATLAEASKVSGQLAANLGFNPERIAKAVVQAKALGFTLDQVAKTTESLLDFQSSIENELKAELLTGKQLNLERARAAALAGDQVTLSEELAKNVGTVSDFTKMNVLQQKSLAAAVGMTTDELAESLRKREEAIASGKSLAQITEDEAKQALERQTIQDKFNQAILKLQDLFGNLLAGPLGSFIDMLSRALGIVNDILANTTGFSTVIGLLVGSQIPSLIKGFTSVVKLIKSAAKLSIAEAIAKAASSAASIPVVGWALAGGVAAGLGSLLYTYLADDMISENGYGKRTLLTPEGTIKLNDKDTVIAGTNLGLENLGKAKATELDNVNNKIPTTVNNTTNNVENVPTTINNVTNNSNQTIPSIDLTPLISAVKEVKASVDKLYNKETTINMDGRQVGTTLVQGSRKLA